jgi:ABC-type protease/lipase transport system fused ATPase/permease subunit
VITMLKSGGCTVIVITHRTSVLRVVDKLLVLTDGQTRLFGPRDEVLAHLRGTPPQPASSHAMPGTAAPAVSGA